MDRTSDRSAGRTHVVSARPAGQRSATDAEPLLRPVQVCRQRVAAEIEEVVVELNRRYPQFAANAGDRMRRAIARQRGRPHPLLNVLGSLTDVYMRLTH